MWTAVVGSVFKAVHQWKIPPTPKRKILLVTGLDYAESPPPLGKGENVWIM